MKKILLTSIILFSISCLNAQSDHINLKSKSIVKNIDKQLVMIHDINYLFMLFDAIPTNEEKTKIEELGVVFLEYIPSNTFVVSIKKNTSISKLYELGVISLLEILPEYKLDPKIQNNIFPDWALKNGKLSLKTLMYNNVNIDDVIKLYKGHGFKINRINKKNKSITITINTDELNNLSQIR